MIFRYQLLFVACVVAIALGAGLSARFAEHQALQEAAAAADQRASLYAVSITRSLERFRPLPFILTLDRDVEDLLDHPDQPELGRRLDRKLEAISRAAGAAALYVMDRDGLTLASSNWSEPGSFVGNNYRFRPYFVDAVDRGAGQYYGIGVTTHEAGFFQSEAIRSDGRLKGVIVVKIDLQPLQAAWVTDGEAVMLADAHGVVFLSSEPDLRYRVLAPLTPEVRHELDVTHQYEGMALRPLGGPGGRIADGATVTLPPVGRAPARRSLVTALALPDEHWTVYLLSDLAPIRTRARLTGGLTGLVGIAGLLLVLYLRQRRLRLKAERDTREELERRVELRTRDLSEANVKLQLEIDERHRAEADLRNVQQELVQSGKLAALGQMSAAVAHEVNQPLAAMQMFLASGRHLLDRGDLSGLGETFDSLGGLVRRMAQMTGHLKAFSRKAAGGLNGVPVAKAVDGALMLTAARLRQSGVAVQLRLPDGATVRAELIRLEQVLVNLLVNAVDAVGQAAEPSIEITCTRHGERWQIAVADNGPGIDPAALPRLFEPFFTTKPQGEGLGLGLSLSYAIVDGFGGTLRAGHSALGGAAFIVELMAVETPEPAAEGGHG